MRRKLAAVAVSLMLAGTALMAGAGPAQAAPAAPAASGVVALFENANFTGAAFTYLYTGCARQTVGIKISPVGSYDNRPAAGCQVRLISQTGAQHVLCAGRAWVPSAFRQSRSLRIQPGVSQPCRVVPVLG